MDDDGGAINWEGSLGLIEDIVCKDNAGLGQKGSTSKGGTICLTGNNVTISDSKFLSGCVYADVAAGAKDNETWAGGLFITGNYTKINNCTFDDCIALEDGGALYVIGNDCELWNSTFTNNNAGDDGGAIYWTGVNGYVENITCTNNKVTGQTATSSNSKGGTICLTGDNATVTKSKFELSSALVDGGALFITGNNVNVTKSDFIDCTVDYTNDGKNHRGGAIFILGNYTNVLDCTFDRSKAQLGGDVFIEGNRVVVDNATSTNAYAYSSGGSVFIQGDNATVSNSDVSLSEAAVSGGAIYIHGNYADIINSSFDTTIAKGAAGTNGGGAIYIDGHHAEVEGSNFTTSKTTGKDAKGGAIYIMGNFAIINASYVENSRTEKIGGAIYIQGNDATVIDSNFSDNYAGEHGGALYSKGVGSKVYNSSFYDNKVKDLYKDKSGKYGGAIYWEGASMNDLIEGCYFEGNMACQGAGVYMASNLNVDTAGTIRNCTFNENRAARGGAIAWEKSKRALIEDCLFTNNIAEKHAAGIFAGAASSSGGEFTIVNCTFEGNTVYAGVGGAISFRISNSKISLCNFINNSAAQGGSIILKETGVSNVVIDQCNFTDSVACSGSSEDGSGGGAIAVWGTDPFSTTSHTRNITVTNSRFVNCSSKVYSGGALDWTSPDGRIENCTFIDCSAPYGGTIGLSAENTNLKNLTIINSASTGNGGAIYIGYIKVKDVEFKTPRNFALTDIKIIGVDTGGNGAIYMGSIAHDITLTNISICNASAAGSGGAMFIDYSKNIVVINANFTNNSAGENGGALFTISGDGNDYKNNPFKISNAIFELNHADGNGGAFYSGYIGTEMSNCNFTSNSAEGNGGAIVIANNYQNIKFATFELNKAILNGGSIYIENEAEINISDTTFKKSQAYNGGAIYVKNNAVTVASVYAYNDTFIDNTASHNGGAILVIIGADSANPIIYRDIDNFEGRATVNATTQRTDLKVTTSTSTLQTIFHSYFKNNKDYPLLVEPDSYRDEVYVVIYINNPRDVEKKSSNITILVSKKDDPNINITITVNEETFDDYYINGRLEIDVPKSFLETDTWYDVNMRFEDGNYLNKSYTNYFKTSDQLKHGDFGILQDMIDMAIRNNKDGIELNRTYRFTIDGVDVRDNSCVIIQGIPDNFTIDGKGHIIDAEGFARIFNITGANVILKNIIFDRGNASGQYNDTISKGGAIYWAGANGQLINCTIRNSYAEYGGGIYYNVTAPDSTIVNCIFIPLEGASYISDKLSLFPLASE